LFSCETFCYILGFAVEWGPRNVEDGKLTKALQAVSPGRKRGPWLIICDNESFPFAPESAAAHKEALVKFWGIPARSPDLNPVFALLVLAPPQANADGPGRPHEEAAGARRNGPR